MPDQADQNKPPANHVMVVYPFDKIGAVTVTGADYARLDEGEFLNDTLIEFGLKCVAPELRPSRFQADGARAGRYWSGSTRTRARTSTSSTTALTSP